MTRRSTVDGFIPRRPNSAPASLSSQGNKGVPKVEARPLRREQPTPTGLVQPSPIQPAVEPVRLSRNDLEDSLKSIDETENSRSRRHKNKGKNVSRRRRIIKWVVIAIIVALLSVGAWVAYHVINASGSVFKGNILGIVQQEKLQQDEGGRTNILVFGTSEDDPGHDAGWLTDSIMLLSINQETKDAYMVSIPRDLEVEFGRACLQGYSGKINGVYGCNYENGENEEAGAKALMAEVSDATGVDIPYYAHVNYTVVRDVVKAIDGITVNIEGSNGAPGVMDSNFDWKCKGGNENASRATMIKNCPPSGHFIDYPNGPAELDAEHALYLAQARGDIEPTYGLGNSNFDREQNQQKIIVAIKDKALSTGTLTNVGKVTGLIDAIGGNLRTNFETSEIRTIMDLAQKIPNESIQRINLLDEKILTPSAQPVKGKFTFTDLRAFIKKKLYATGLSREDARIIVLNASGVAGVAQAEADKLTALGMTVEYVGNAPAAATAGTNSVYHTSETAKTKTAAKLKELYGSEAIVAPTIPGVTIGDMTDYVIIVGKDPEAPKTSQ